MTKREICERLLHINDYAKAASHWGSETSIKDFQEAARHLANEARAILLDLAAPEEEPKRETPEAEEKRPPIIIYKENGPKRKCPYCGTWSFFDTVDNSFYCENCEGHFGKYSYPAIEEPKRETPEAEEKHTSVWIHPCPKCGTSSPRAAHMDGYTYYCPKCKQYFVDAAGELKRGEGEK